MGGKLNDFSIDELSIVFIQYFGLYSNTVIIVYCIKVYNARCELWCGGTVASWLVRSSPDRAVRVQALAGDIVLCSWARHLTLTVPLSTQEYKWVLANYWGNLTNCWGVTCDGLASHPEGVEILLAASCYRNWDKLQQLIEPVLAPRLHFSIVYLPV